MRSPNFADSKWWISPTLITPGTPLKKWLGSGFGRCNTWVALVPFLDAGSSPSDFELIPQSQRLNVQRHFGKWAHNMRHSKSLASKTLQRTIQHPMYEVVPTLGEHQSKNTNSTATLPKKHQSRTSSTTQVRSLSSVPNFRLPKNSTPLKKPTTLGVSTIWGCMNIETSWSKTHHLRLKLPQIVAYRSSDKSNLVMLVHSSDIWDIPHSPIPYQSWLRLFHLSAGWSLHFTRWILSPTNLAMIWQTDLPPNPPFFSIWRFETIGVPLVIIHFRLGFSMK